VTEARHQWITRYLNAASASSPSRSRSSSATSPAVATPGSSHASTASATMSSSGRSQAATVELSDGRVDWWVLDDGHRARRREASTWTSSGHAAAVLGDEL
jgi:hypothetical protein